MTTQNRRLKQRANRKIKRQLVHDLKMEEKEKQIKPESPIAHEYIYKYQGKYDGCYGMGKRR